MIIVIVLLVLVVGGLFIYVGMKKAPAGNNQYQAPALNNQQQNLSVLPAPTGNADDAANAILAGSANDAAVTADEANDSSLVGSDTQVISGFGQSYDEKAF